MTGENRPISQIYAEIGQQWADADARATILEDTASAHRSQMILEMMTANPNMALNRAEVQVRASREWIDRVHETVEARREANHLKVKLDSLRMAHSEWTSQEANERVVAKL